MTTSVTQVEVVGILDNGPGPTVLLRADVHVTCLLGAASVLAAERHDYSGRVMVVFQPAEELGSGAKAMVDDGLFDLVAKPDVVLGQHVAPLPAGMIGRRAAQRRPS